jgi:hypothetical protein
LVDFGESGDHDPPRRGREFLRSVHRRDLFLVLQDEVSHFTEYWSFIIGFVLILCVRFLTTGISGMLLRIGRARPAGVGTAGDLAQAEAGTPDLVMAMTSSAAADRKAGP